MGPVIGVVTWNALGSLIAIICVYIFLHRGKLRKYTILAFLTKPMHKLIIKIAKKSLRKRNTK